VILQICRNQLTTGTYNVADTGGISTVELINIIGQALGKKPLIWNWNRGLVSGIFSMGTWLNLPANKETFRKLTSDYLVNTDKLHTAMGSQLPVDTRNGLRDTFSSFI
jgi:nucleoside-diphosphate-sugar epimerase